MLQNSLPGQPSPASGGIVAHNRPPPLPGRSSPRYGKFTARSAKTLAAYREYEQLRSSGLPHDAALKHSLGIGPSQRACRTARPLYFCRTGLGSFK